MARIASNKLTQEIFLNRVSVLHPNLDFSKSQYIKNSSPVIVICKLHGELQMHPTILFAGSGCKLCSASIAGFAKMQKAGLDFIDRCNIVHNNFYIYDKTTYIGAHQNITVTCPEHGDFICEANNHVRGSRM